MMKRMILVRCLLLVVKKNNILQLQVDAASEHSVGLKQSHSSGGKHNVYVGGVPGESTNFLRLSSLESIGCLFI